MQFAIRPQKLTSVDLFLARIYINLFQDYPISGKKEVILKLSSLKYLLLILMSLILIKRAPFLRFFELMIGKDQSWNYTPSYPFIQLHLL